MTQKNEKPTITSFVKNNIYASAFIICLLIIIYTWIVSIANNYGIDTRFLLANILVVIGIITFFKNKNIFILVTTLILLLTTFGVIGFSVTTVRDSYSIRIEEIIIGTPLLDFNVLWILILHLSLNRHVLVEMIREKSVWV